MEFKSLCTSSGVGGLDRVRGTPLWGIVARIYAEEDDFHPRAQL